MIKEYCKTILYIAIYENQANLNFGEVIYNHI